MWSEYFLFQWKNSIDILAGGWRSAYNGYLFYFVRLSRPFFAILSMLLTYSVTLAVWQSCMSSCEERKCQGLSNLVVGVSCHVITLRLRKMSCFFCDIGFTGFSKRSLKRIIMCLSSFSFLYQIKYQQRSQIWRFFGAYKNCVAQLFDGWDHGLFRFLYYTRSLIYIL